MNENINVISSRVAASVTYSGSALTAGSSYAASQQHAPIFDLSDLGILVGIVTAICGLALQAYFGWKNVALKKAAYEKLGKQADALESDKVPL
jgi:H+/gluconate symporter-like permease